MVLDRPGVAAGTVLVVPPAHAHAAGQGDRGLGLRALRLDQQVLVGRRTAHSAARVASSWLAVSSAAAAVVGVAVLARPGHGLRGEQLGQGRRGEPGCRHLVVRAGALARFGDQPNPTGRGTRPAPTWPRSRCRTASAAAPWPVCCVAADRGRHPRRRRCSGPASRRPGPVSTGESASVRRVASESRIAAGSWSAAACTVSSSAVPLPGRISSGRLCGERDLGADLHAGGQQLGLVVVDQGGDVRVAVRQPVAVADPDQLGQLGQPGLRRGRADALAGASVGAAAPGSRRPWPGPPGPGPGRRRSWCRPREPPAAARSAGPRRSARRPGDRRGTPRSGAGSAGWSARRWRSAAPSPSASRRRPAGTRGRGRR